VKRPRSLQARVLALTMVAVLVAWLASAIATAIDVREEVDELLDAHLAQSAAILAARTAGDFEGEHHAEADALHRYAPKVAFCVLHEGRVVLTSVQPPPWTAQEQPGRKGFRTVKAGGESWRVFSARGSEGDVRVEVGERVDSRADIVEAVVRSMLWPAAASAPLLLLAVWWSVRRGLAPLRELGWQLRRRSPADLQPLPHAGAPSEVAPLVDSLNGLFARIAVLLESERRFTSDAAHELRTPVAAIRAQAQVALGSSDDDERRRALHATLAGCDRATRLVEQLLTLSRLEASQSPPLHPVDLARIAREQLASLAATAVQKQQELQLDAPAACVIDADEALAGVLVRNLVDNALRYSASGDRVTVSVAPAGPHVALVVEDSGPGLPEGARERLGERFFRPLGTASPGSGLGWSIVQRIAAAHRADIQCDASPTLGGLRVTVRWPAAQAPVNKV
jgi:two-component system sensor histidine kinase QseC